MLPKLIAGFLACLALTACAGRVDRGNPFASSARQVQSAPAVESYVWARNDGQRMSANPALLRQGQKDQAECRDQATSGGTLNRNAFVQCMQKRGYSQRPAS